MTAQHSVILYLIQDPSLIQYLNAKWIPDQVRYDGEGMVGMTVLHPVILSASNLSFCYRIELGMTDSGSILIFNFKLDTGSSPA